MAKTGVAIAPKKAQVINITDGNLTKVLKRKAGELEFQLAKVERELEDARAKKPVDVEGLRKAIEARAATWREELRKSPELARLILKRLVGPLKLHEQPPAWMIERYGPRTFPVLDVGTWSAEVKPEGLLEAVGSQLGSSPRR